MSWNGTLERQLPFSMVGSVGYVATRTIHQLIDRNINTVGPGIGTSTANLPLAKLYGRTIAMNMWDGIGTSNYHSLQALLTKRFSQGLMVRTSYTFGKSLSMADEDGWVGLTWNHPLKFQDNFALGGFDRTHVFQMGFLYALPFLKDSSKMTGKLLGGWQLNGIFAKYSGTPYSIGGSNSALNCSSCGSILINFSGDPKPVGKVGSSTTETYYDKSLFSQPTGAAKEGFGTSLRNNFRRPRVWNTDLSLFKQFRVTERIHPEFRIEAVNVFNHTNWGAPVTGFTANNFLQFTPSNSENGTNSPGARRVQLGFRVVF